MTSVTVNPAYVRTPPLVEKQIADQAATHKISEDEVVQKIMLDRVHVKRLVEPEEVGELVVFLTGPASASMSGTSYPIDGGPGPRTDRRITEIQLRAHLTGCARTRCSGRVRPGRAETLIILRRNR